MNKLKKISALVLLLLFTPFLFAQPSPISLLEQTATNIIESLKQNQASLKQNPALVAQTVERYLLPQVDIEGMSRSVLGKTAWNRATSAQRKQFSRLFTQLLIRTYAGPLAEYRDESVKFLPIRGGYDKRFVMVNSYIIRAHANNIPLDYSLIFTNNSWKIYDMSVEGVSFLQSFRSQFAQELQNTGMDALITQLEKKTQKK